MVSDRKVPPARHRTLQRPGFTVARSTGAAVGLLADLALGEPPSALHPVARFGQCMAALERRQWRDGRVAGVAYAAVGLGSALATGMCLDALILPGLATGAAGWASTGGRALATAARDVGTALDRGDLAAARRALPSLVGRDPTDLDEREMARAVVESVGENTADAVVAPALWAACAGAPGVLAHRAVNTMDAMVGYRSERYRRYGWFAARLDDVMAWPAARLTAVLVAVVRPRSAVRIWRVVRRDAGAHPSPNAGISEAAFAACLGVRLGGENRYGGRLEVRPTLGDGGPPRPDDIERAVRLQMHVTWALAALLLVPAFARGVVRGAAAHTAHRRVQK